MLSANIARRQKAKKRMIFSVSFFMFFGLNCEQLLLLHKDNTQIMHKPNKFH